jgi:hypothetical protein
VGNKITRTNIDVGKIAASAAGHQYLFTCLVGMVQYEHLTTAPTRLNRTHQPGGASTDYQNICLTGFMRQGNG